MIGSINGPEEGLPIGPRMQYMVENIASVKLASPKASRVCVYEAAGELVEVQADDDGLAEGSGVPRPKWTEWLGEAGKTLDIERSEIKSRREFGLTKLDNHVNDPDIADSAATDFAQLLQIHVELVGAVIATYGWDGFPLGHGFHTCRQMRCWTVSSKARVEILDRLLDENYRRAAVQGEALPPAGAEDPEGEDA